jgi:hypothetical protein
MFNSRIVTGVTNLTIYDSEFNNCTLYSHSFGKSVRVDNTKFFNSNFRLINESLGESLSITDSHFDGSCNLTFSNFPPLLIWNYAEYEILRNKFYGQNINTHNCIEIFNCGHGGAWLFIFQK